MTITGDIKHCNLISCYCQTEIASTNSYQVMQQKMPETKRPGIKISQMSKPVIRPLEIDLI